MSILLMGFACLAGEDEPVLNLNNITVNDVFDPSYAGFRINRDGTIESRDSAGYTTLNGTTDWIESAYQTATVGDAYEFMTVKSSGDSLTGVTDSVYQTIDGSYQGYITTSALPKSYTGTLYVREIANTSNIVSCTLTFDAAIA